VIDAQLGLRSQIMTPILSNEEWMSFCAIMNGYIYSQTLATACDFDLFTYVSKHPGATQEELGEMLALSSYSTRVLLLACCAVGLIYRAEENLIFFAKPVSYTHLTLPTICSV